MRTSLTHVAGIVLPIAILIAAACGENTAPPPRPTAPTGVTATLVADQVILAWTPVAGATTYNIYWSASPAVGLGSATVVDSANNPYPISDVLIGYDHTTYFVVTAVAAHWESPPSATVFATLGVQALEINAQHAPPGGTVGITYLPSPLRQDLECNLRGGSTRVGWSCRQCVSLTSCIALPACYSGTHCHLVKITQGTFGFGASGGVLPYRWSAASLPPGLALVNSTGQVTGTPTEAGTFNVAVTLTDAAFPQDTAIASFVIVIAP